jgi:thiol:disulfide interchange protein DsbD
MARLRQFLAFPLYATVAWLAWVIGAQVDNDAVIRLLATLVIVALALWAWGTFRSGGGRPWSITAVAAALCALVVAWPLLRGDAIAADGSAPRAAKRDPGWQPYSPARLAELTGAGRAVFVDFTAAWCVTCQVNKRLVLNDAGVRDAFARRNVTLVRADWTRRDPEITRALAALGRNGVPVYVLYRPGREPLLLPEVLHKQMIVDALSTI